MITKSLSRLLLVGFALVATGTYAQSIYEPFAFSTFAGTAGVVGGHDGTGAAAQFASPSQIAVDAAGNFYIADTGNHTIRKITPAAVVTTFAGTAGMPGSADGTGSAARFNSPIGIAIDSSGNLFVGDADNDTIRKITPAGVVTTFAGTAGMVGSADGTGSAARFSGPRGIAVDSAGNVYVADTFNNTIRKITPGRVVTTLAGLAGAFGSADGTGSAARFNRPRGLSIDANSNLFVADTANNTIRKITPAGVVTTVAGSAGVSGSADGSVFAARFFGPIGIGVSNSGDVYVADTVNDTIRKISSAGAVTTLGGMPLVAGSANGVGSNARFASPQSVIPHGTSIFVSDTGNNTIRRGQGPTPTPSPSPGASPAQFLNISTRLRVETGQNVMIGGFIVTGTDQKTVLIRAIGPSLVHSGLSDVLADPVLELHAENGSVILTDDNWQDDPAQAALITATGIPPQDNRESAMVVTLAPGSYTAVVSGRNGTSGVGLVEIYDINRATNSTLANISTRGFVQAGDNVMIGGFILGEGSQNRRILVRAIGPSLSGSGIANALADPTLELRDSNGALIGSNDDWRTRQEAEIQATGIPPTNDLESALIAELPPGNYTAIVAGKNGSVGVGLVEAYALQ